MNQVKAEHVSLKTNGDLWGSAFSIPKRLQKLNVITVYICISIAAVTLCSHNTCASVTTLSSAPLTAGYCQQSSDLVTVDCFFRNVSSFSSALNDSLSTISNPEFVRTLDISDYAIHTLTQQVFYNFKNLTRLLLPRNGIVTMMNNAFEGLTRLLELYLDNNEITMLNQSIFSHISNLIVLDVSYNSITNVASKTFQSLRYLQKLYLQSNLITVIESGAFNGLIQLKELNLNGNLVSQVFNGTFQDVTGLTHLTMSSNRLTILNGVIVNGLVKLLVLDVSNNKIATFTNKAVGYLRQMTNLTNLNASINPVHCDCKIRDFLVWIQNVTFASENNMPLCHFPQGLSGISVLNVSLGDVDAAVVDCNHNNNNNNPTVQKTTISMLPTMTPPPYNEMLGWYTAIVLGSILGFFILCLILDKIKRRFYKRLKRRLKKIEQQEQREQEEQQKSAGGGGEKSGLDTPTMLGSVNMENDDIIEEGVEATEPLNQIMPLSKNGGKTMSESNINTLSVQDRKNLDKSEAHQPMLSGAATAEGGSVITKEYNSKPLIPPVEVFPGITILEVNPDCPLHGTSQHTPSSRPVNGVAPHSGGALNSVNTVLPNNNNNNTTLFENNNNNSEFKGAVPKRGRDMNSADPVPGKVVTTKL